MRKYHGRIWVQDLKDYGEKYNLPEGETTFICTGFWVANNSKVGSYELADYKHDDVISFSRDKAGIFYIEAIN